ncbi:MAG TPA: sulfatase-like hydrolase/transferase [Planctomycetaceae bacterium]|nr:sulfatase-like hydrolase/transferase [Planctomycetaceae bacterium]
MTRSAILLMLLAVSAPKWGVAAESPPNVIIILADDMGWSDLGCYGGEIETPHLDALARGGVRFTQFYNTGRCCPTRAALLTGLYQHQAGMGHMTGNDGIPSYQGFLNDRCATIAEAIRPAGYTTFLAGKWHVGSARGHWPLDRGFDRFWGTPSGGGVYFRDTLKVRTNVFFASGNERVEPPEDLYVTETFTTQALRFIEEAVMQTRQPFFLYLAHIAPHWPLQAKPADISKYRGRYDAGWDAMRRERFERQRRMGLIPADARLNSDKQRARRATALLGTPGEQGRARGRLEGRGAKRKKMGTLRPRSRSHRDGKPCRDAARENA